MNSHLKIYRTSPKLENEIAVFFNCLVSKDHNDFFEPHPLTSQYASVIANYRGKDIYAFIIFCKKIIGYGMLRGWDDGYGIPSLGISVHPDFRGLGIGLKMMHYLHSTAIGKGCSHIRLRVKKNNYRAIKFYTNLGYELNEDSEEYLIGQMQLTPIKT